MLVLGGSTAVPALLCPFGSSVVCALVRLMRAKGNCGGPAPGDPAMLDASPGTAAALKSIGWACWAWGRLEGVCGTREASAMALQLLLREKSGKNRCVLAVKSDWKRVLVGDGDGYTKPWWLVWYVGRTCVLCAYRC